ncbi:MAG: GNAT family N-acetyltransferase [bacterium]|nr:GNAT family N-acetyltransferase [bacterium]
MMQGDAPTRAPGSAAFLETLLEALERDCFPDNAWTAPQIAASLLSPAFRVILIAGDASVQDYRVAPDPSAPPDQGDGQNQDPREAAGYALLQELEGENTVEILRLGIRPDFRRRGLALSLLENLDRINVNFSNPEESETGGPISLLLEVSAENAGALALYQRHGFEELARRRGYYRSRDGSGPVTDAIVLRKTLSNPEDSGQTHYDD